MCGSREKFIRYGAIVPHMQKTWNSKQIIWTFFIPVNGCNLGIKVLVFMIIEILHTKKVKVETWDRVILVFLHKLAISVQFFLVYCVRFENRFCFYFSVIESNFVYVFNDTEHLKKTVKQSQTNIKETEGIAHLVI